MNRLGIRINSAVLFLIMLLNGFTYCIVNQFRISGLWEIFFFVYIFAFVLWIYSFKERFTGKGLKLYLYLLGCSMIFFVFLSIIKYSFFPDSRLVWYMYYIPLLLMPLFAFLAFLYVGREDDAYISKKWRFLFIPQALLIIAVLTNDYHQLVFRLEPDVQNYSGSYSYNFIYYIIAGDIAVYLLLMTVRVLYTCARKRFIKKIYLPLMVIAVAGIYIATFIKIPEERNLLVSTFSMPVAICIFSMGYFESIVSANLIPSNKMHVKFFRTSSIKAGLFDKDFNIVTSSDDIGVTAENIKDSFRETVSFNGNYILKSSPVSGGYFYWLEDVTDINRLNAELKETENYLNDENAILDASTRTEERNRRTVQKNRLYDEIALKVKSQLDTVDSIINSAALKKDDDFREDMKLAGIYGVFIKRYSNLLLITAENDYVDLGELKLSVEESLRFAALSDINTECFIQSGMSVKSSLILYLYELFETSLEQVLTAVNAVSVKLVCENNGLNLTMLFTLPENHIVSFSEFEKSEQGGLLKSEILNGGILRITFEKEVTQNADE